MTWAAVIGGSASLIGGGLAAGSAKDAANTAADANLQASREATKYARETRDLGLSISAPQRQAGYTSLAGMMDMMGLNRGSPASTVPEGSTPEEQAAAQEQANRLYPPPPNEWGSTPQEWYDYVDQWYQDPSQFQTWSGRAPGNAVDNAYQDLASGKANSDQWKNVPKLSGDQLVEGHSPGYWGSYISNAVNNAVQDGTTRTGGTAADGQFQANRIDPNTGLPITGSSVNTPSLDSFDQYDWQQSPSYDFRVNEGMRAIDNSASARGLSLSGGTLRGVQQYGQDMATQEFDNVYNRLATLAGYGQVANQTSSNAVNQAGAALGNSAGYIADAGASRASGYQAAGNAWQNAGNQIGQIAGYAWGGSNPKTSGLEYIPIGSLPARM